MVGIRGDADKNMAKVIEKAGFGISFEEMKIEFTAMDNEIKEKTEEIRVLRIAMTDSQKRCNEQEVDATKHVDEMEELHENLAELDGRFERSERLNEELRAELEFTKTELQRKNDELCENIVKAEIELSDSRDKYEDLRKEYESFKVEAVTKYDSLVKAIKDSVENTYKNVKDYLERKRARKFSRRGKSYRMLLSLESELHVMLMSYNRASLATP